MEFQKKKAIYLQIADFVCEQILLKKWRQGEKIPSVRELAVMLEVNPNTITRTYASLEEMQVIRMERGIGFFVENDAIAVIIKQRKQEFIKEDLPRFFKKMQFLELSLEDLRQYYPETKVSEKK